MLFDQKISVIAPAHNEEGCIEEFIRKVNKTFKDNGIGGELIIINDASTDRTLEIAANLKKEIKILRVVSHRKNKGLTAGIKTGIENSKHDYVLFLPSDLQSDPEEDIPKLLKPLNEGYDFVIGNKAKRKQFFKGISSAMFNFVARKLFKADIHDMGWVKVFKKEIYYNVEPLRSDWHRFFVFLAANEGYKIKEVPVKIYSRTTGKSHYGKMGLGRAPGAFFDMIVIKFLISFSKKPMRIFGAIGAILTFLGLLSGLYVLYIVLTLGTLADRIPSMLLTVFLILTGLQFFAIGFLAELIVSINERKNK